MQLVAGTSLITDQGTTEAAELAVTAMRLRSRLERGAVHRIETASPLDVITAILGVDGHASRVELVPDNGEALSRFSVPESFSGNTDWVIYTSGTTGEPKPIVHSLASLSRAMKPADGHRVWGLVYDPRRLAGIAVILQALSTGSTLVDARKGNIAERVRFMRQHHVTALSATPTLWRQILQSGQTENWKLNRITLGGETADQRILDALTREFPEAHITHVFAASESGVVFSVGDGVEGFPRSYLDSPPRGVSIQVRDGILWVQNPASSLADDEGYVSTGDVVNVSNDRVLFRGRESGVVNVGGTKVFPEQVENELRRHPAVIDALVRAKSNPFSGSILIAQVVLDDGYNAPATSASIRAWLADHLPAPLVPATVTVVDQLESSTTGKAVRR